MNRKSTYKILDLFCGVGGFHIGFGHEGFKTILAVDVDEYCEKFHCLNLPEIPFLRKDIRFLTNRDLEKFVVGTVDVLVGGPPCQGFSTIGNRISADPERRKKTDSRNDLFREYIRILRFLKPKVFLMENVKGLLTRDKGAVFNEMKKQFYQTGYQFNHVILNAADFGVPQIRERVFFYGTRLGLPMSPPKATHGEGKGLKPYITVQEVISDLAHNGKHAKNHVPLKHGEINLQRYSLIPEGGRLPEDQLPKELYRRNFGNTFKRLHRNRLSLTMVPGHNAFPIHPWLDRSLTVREAARIQTFSDNFEFVGPRHAQCIQVGNAVPIKLAEAWARSLRVFLDRYYER